VFGRVIGGYSLIEAIERGEVGIQDRPLEPVEVVSSGELIGERKLTQATAIDLEIYQ
jgi:hypothetical protein